MKGHVDANGEPTDVMPTAFGNCAFFGNCSVGGYGPFEPCLFSVLADGGCFRNPSPVMLAP